MVLVLAGDNRFLLQSKLDKVVSEFVEAHGEMGLERLDAEEASLERVKESLLGSMLFAEQKLVVLKNIETNKQLLESLEQIIGAIPESTEVVMTISKLDKRAKYYKDLKKLTDFQELGSLDNRSLAGWVVDEAKSQQASINFSDAQYLVDRVGTNQAVLKQELDKLIIHNPKIERASIDELTEALPQSTVFELLDAAFAGNRSKTMSLYEEQRQLKTEPLAILGMIAWQLHVLALVVTAKDKTPGDIAKEAKVHPFVVNKTKNIARKISYPRLKQLVEEALTLDIRLKSQSINADDALKHYLLTISSL